MYLVPGAVNILFLPETFTIVYVDWIIKLKKSINRKICLGFCKKCINFLFTKSPAQNTCKIFDIVKATF